MKYKNLAAVDLINLMLLEMDKWSLYELKWLLQSLSDRLDVKLTVRSLLRHSKHEVLYLFIKELH